MTTTASAICAASASSQRPHRAPACRVNVQLTSTSALQRGMLPYFAFRPWRWHRLEANSISFPMVYCETCGSTEKLVKNGSKSVVNSTILFAFLQPMSVAAHVYRSLRLKTLIRPLCRACGMLSFPLVHFVAPKGQWFLHGN